PRLQAGRERVGADASYTRFVRSDQARFPGLTVLDGRRIGFGHKVFTDGIHLDARGASAFSASVASALAPDLSLAARTGALRWVELRAHLAPPVPEGPDSERRTKPVALSHSPKHDRPAWGDRPGRR